MKDKPFPVTAAELKEIAAVPELQELWGMGNTEEMAEVLESAYLARFEFMNQSPGYQGDLFVIQSDFLDSDVPAIRLIRGRGRQLEIVR